MVKRILISLAVSFGAFALCWHFIRSVTQTTCGPREFDSCVQLKQLHYYMIPYLEFEENPLPDTKHFNKIITANYQKDPSHEVFENTRDKDYLLLQLTKKISEDRNLRPWNTPPIYIRDETLPEGYGFYLAGEDGVSNTAGRDPDDLNSWNISSYHFYPKRTRQHISRRITYISIIPASLVFLLLMTRRKNK